MRNLCPIRRRPKPSEEGFLLLAVMFLLAILVLSLAAAAPRIARSIQRDRDLETMHRGKQYIRAVQLYYRKFHAYPPNRDALVKTNEIRFLRKRYIDPMTGKDDWKPILFGQNKAPIAMGFFGQPLATGSSMAGIGPSGGNGLNGANGSSAGGGLFNSPGSSGGSGFGSSPGSSGSSMFGPSNSGVGSTPAAGSTDNSAGSASNGAGQVGGTGVGGTGAGGTNGNPASGTGSGLTGQTGQTFGGGGVIGFSPASPKQSILIYKKKDHYNEWEFTYDPIMEMMTVRGGNTGAIGQPAGGMPGAVGIPGITAPGTGATSSPGAGGGAGSPSTTPPETSVPPQP
jgi:type II secretory pathway pseudopilin PulG